MGVKVVWFPSVLLREILEEKMLLCRVNQKRPKEHLKRAEHQLLLHRSVLALLVVLGGLILVL